MNNLRLSQEELYRKCDPNIFKVTTSKEIKVKNSFIPQNRALSSCEVAINIKGNNHHIFAMGEKGIGKADIIARFLKDNSKKLKDPKDWIYVYNFKNANKPIAISLKQKEAKIFKKYMQDFIQSLKIIIFSTFEDKTYKEHIIKIDKLFLSKKDKQIHLLQNEAEKLGVQIIKESDGFAIVALDSSTQNLNYKEDIAALKIEEKDELSQAVSSIKYKLEKMVLSFPAIDKEKVLQITKHHKKTLQKIITPLTRKIKKKWKNNKDIQNYLDNLQEYILESDDIFIVEDSNNNFTNVQFKIPYENFEVNILVDQSQNINNKHNTPIIILNHPTPSELFGSIELKANSNSVTTNFNNIKAGYLHLANGGYLVMPIKAFLEYPSFWKLFKNILNNKRIEFSNLSEEISSSFGITPMSIPLDIKIILTGSESIYYALWDKDEDFRELFSVIADFDDKIEYNNANIRLFAEILTAITKQHKLLPLDKFALARTIEVAAKIAGKQSVLSANLAKITNVLQEANYFAKKNNRKIINADDVHDAYFDQINRHSKIKEHFNNKIKDKTILLDIHGQEIGQINALAVVGVNDIRFGNPQKITCLVYRGKKGLVDIERNVKLSGSIHSKGLLIMQSYINAAFAKNVALNFSATLVFEQSYSKIDGDSASCAELFCLLSALSNIPLKQSIAISGSMNQKGLVQSVGDVNTKIIGFFDVCKEKLDGSHGVIIPKTNVKDLMLPVEIRKAVEKKLFNIYAIERIEEGFEILTDAKLYIDEENGEYPQGSIGYDIQQKWQ